ncbi:hypothetical protein PIROE2DRAFT_2964 [Piromyces sp. E2]|nr:hypothetical protein PIROE2DRAFT_2964 [Piromyces sp. E2]|eukprot:OUM69255.1 hypothetical protein PIROE2DRAFT_2964 [Piromyces sp. E2]
MLCFIEWNINETFNDVRILMTSIYFNIVSFIGVLIIKYIEDNNHDIFDIIYNCFIIIFILSNYLFTFGIRIILKLIRKKEVVKIKNIHKSKTLQTFATNSTGTKKLIAKIITYHNKTSIIEDSSYSLDNSSANGIENFTFSVTI